MLGPPASEPPDPPPPGSGEGEEEEEEGEGDDPIVGVRSSRQRIHH